MEYLMVFLLLLLENSYVIPNSPQLKEERAILFKEFSPSRTSRDRADSWNGLRSSLNAISTKTLQKRDLKPFTHILDGREQKILKFTAPKYEEPLENVHLSRKLRKSKPLSSTEKKLHHTSNYNFRYQVKNREASHGHQEVRKNRRVTGTYYVDLPSGLRQIVKYYADEMGYHPTIIYVPINKTTMPNTIDGSPSLQPPSIKEVRYDSLNFPNFDLHKNTKGGYYGFRYSFPYSKPTSIVTRPTPSTSVSPTVPPSSSGKNEMKIAEGRGIMPLDNQTTEFPPQIIDPEFIRKRIIPSEQNITTIQKV